MVVREESCSEGADALGGNVETAGARPLHVFLLAVLPPILIAALNEWAIGYGNQTHWRWPAHTILYTLYVAQVSLLSVYLGRYISSWFLRWAILIWVLLLIDLRLATLAFGNSSSCLIYAFLASQSGLLVFVATLGPGAWPWRLPSALVAAVVVLYSFSVDGPWGKMWSTLLLIQTVVTLPLFGMLLLAGYRLQSTGASNQGVRSTAARTEFSFSIGHMLFWMLAAVPVLTLGQYIDPMAIGFLAAVGVWSRMLFTAACLSIVPLLVVLTVFSRKRTVLMAVGSLILLTILGFYMAASLADDLTGYAQRTWQLWIISDLPQVGYWWIGWNLLSAAFLAALLLMFRSAGYRLEHRRQPRSPFAENAR